MKVFLKVFFYLHVQIPFLLLACFYSVDEKTRLTPVKVIRHVNGPSAWISSIEDGPICTVKPPDPLKTHSEPSSSSELIQHRLEERNIAEKQVSKIMVRHPENDSHGSGDSYEGKQVNQFLNQFFKSVL